MYFGRTDTGFAVWVPPRHQRTKELVQGLDWLDELGPTKLAYSGARRREIMEGVPLVIK